MGVVLKALCQHSPLGLALLTRPPVRLCVTVCTGAKGFSGLPNQNPVLTVSSAQRSCRALYRRTRQSYSKATADQLTELPLAGVLNHLRKGSWCQFSSP